ncbi:Glutathione transport system permease protein gsiC [Acholeplasma oculi]|uniref:Oligopeptide ABC transport system, permease protein OppB1 n=1 Tax=Acholeplasma oculi TaxID=35623 RepID=A0A061AH10_9MOLU|nr:ABC transporter permease [Acholeplasma oculi]CDR30217.1 Oligopeptide ABC transport system, permease protein OppB1 [Acholeplasma oculi]SKC43853.1 peptide/nickel transport system permease protein [Acholeplasma oculi]SUT88596.1 Glutathione transport system permease protein gsiC [Acholeplasma oculi]
MNNNSNQAKKPIQIMNKIANFLYKYRFLFVKVGVALITVFLATILIFFVLRLIPGDIVHNYALNLASQRNIPYEEARRLAVMMLNYDPNENIFLQFARYFGGIMRGELGRSLYTEAITANLIIKNLLPWTLFIASVSLLISFLIGTKMGASMARKRDGKKHKVYFSFIVVSTSIPDYLIGLLLVSIFAYRFGLFPPSGNYDIKFDPGLNIGFILSVLHHAFLPVLAYVISQIGSWAMLMRGSAIGVLGEDYIMAARARGVSEKVIAKKYLHKNALLPLITSMAVSFGILFGGAPLMESIFNYPGIGSELSARIGSRDFFVVQGILFFTSVMVIIVNLIADSIYSFIDPRIRRDSE